MIVHVDPGSPWWIQGAAASVLTLHIGGGVVGLASGTVAAVAPKGGRVHRTAGNVFFVAMLTMAAMASVASPFMSSVPQQANLVGGVFTFYLVATARMTVRRPEGSWAASRFGSCPLSLPLSPSPCGSAGGSPICPPPRCMARPHRRRPCSSASSPPLPPAGISTSSCARA